MASNANCFAYDLESEQEVIMSKKLLFAVCRDYWENDQDTLCAIQTSELLTELHQSQRSLNEISCHLYQIVNGLNKREKYYPVAKKLIWKLSDELYDSQIKSLQDQVSSCETQQSPMNAPSTHHPLILEIAKIFEQDDNAQRIHKMLFALSQKCWENNPDIFTKYSLEELIPQVRYAHPTLERLSINLLKIIKGLNKQGIYTQVAQTIIRQFSKLYEQKNDLYKLRSFVKFSQESDSKSTQTIPLAQSSKEPRKYYLNYNPYQLRQQIIHNRNPLRVKSLLFYVLHPEYEMEKQEENNFLIQSDELDDMLLQLFQKFTTVQELQSQLESTALRFAAIYPNILNVEDSLDIVQAIVASMKPIYHSQ